MSKLESLDKSLIIKKVDKETVNIRLNNNDLLIAIVGQFNQNLKELEKLTKTNIYSRGNSITAKGKPSDIEEFSKAIRFLANKFNLTKSIEKNDILLAVRNRDDTKSGDNIHSLNQLIKTPRKSVIARSKKQSDYIDALRKNDIVMAVGPAGTGKSFLAVSVGITMLMEKKIERVILSRPAVEAGEKLGFLPGDLSQKVDPYLRPLYDALYEMLGIERTEKYLEKGIVEIAPLAYMRGRTLNNSFIIVDESQNTTKEQMKMILTRMGFGSYLLINGDLTQIDLPKNIESGLAHAVRVVNDTEDIGVVHFDSKDIVRHPLVRKIIDAYKRFES